MSSSLLLQCYLVRLHSPFIYFEFPIVDPTSPSFSSSSIGVRVGRHPLLNDLFLDDIHLNVSRCGGQFVPLLVDDHWEWQINDINSARGIWINGKRVKNKIS